MPICLSANYWKNKFKKKPHNDQAKMQCFAICFDSAPKDEINEAQKKLI